MEHAKGYVTVGLPSGEVDLELGWNEVADLDRVLKSQGNKPFIPSLLDMQEGALDVDVLRLAFYHALRNSKLKSAKEAGKLLVGADLATVVSALADAAKASGLLSDDEDSGEA